MASPSGSQNGGILGVSNKTSFGKCTVTSKTSTGLTPDDLLALGMASGKFNFFKIVII